LATPDVALIVEPSLADAMFVVSTLSLLGFRVIASDNFHEAKALLREPPALLVSELRLSEYNGLHLVLRAKSARPDMAAIVTTQVADPVLQAEAERMGATFVLKPTTSEEFRAAVCRTLFRSPDSLGQPIRAPFEQRKADRRRGETAEHRLERRVSDRRREVTALIQHQHFELS
jgi:DNA-binding NtrC family response regulator